MTRRELLQTAWVAALDSGASAEEAGSEMPRLQDLNGGKVLFVAGRPFLILALQWDCDSCFAPEIMDPLFPEAAKMGCNTAVLPLYWREVEPREGEFDLSGLEHRIDMARRNGLRVVLVWFGSYKNGCLNYAPDFVKRDTVRFRRAHQADGTPLQNFSCSTSAETFAADRRALETVFRRLKTVDAERHTVILFQMENEAGLLGTDRCYCRSCTASFEKGGWASREKERAAEAFTAHSFARYLDDLAGAVKSIYPLPIYINCWLGSKATGVAGKDYPSGGPVERVLDIYAASIRHIDFIAPDIYSHAPEPFRAVSRAYSDKGWPLYIAEHSSGRGGRAERNVFYALGEHGAIGFAPWAIDRAFPDIDGRPFVHQLDQRWSEEAYDLRDSYVPIRDAMVPAALAQSTGRLKYFVEEQGVKEARLEFEGVIVQVSFRHRNAMARGMAIRTGETDFLVLGTGFDARFLTPDGRGIPLARVERGRFEGDRWRVLLPIRREREDRSLPFRVIEPQVVRVALEPRA